MKKFVCVYRVPVETMQKWRAETAPEVMQKQGKEIGEKMGAWIEKHKKSIVDMGNPLGKNKRLTAEGLTDMTNDLNAYIVVEAESAEDVAKMFKEGNPQFDIPTAYVDIMEIPQHAM